MTSSCSKIEPRAPVLSKAQNYRLWQSEAFGNKLRAWRTIPEWRASGYRGKVALRSLLPSGGGGPCIYDVDHDLVELSHARLAIDVLPEHIAICEAAPADVAVLQGEYLNSPLDKGPGCARHGYFYYSRARRQMRDALREHHSVLEGLAADLLIRRFMNTATYEDWRDLLDRYPDHVLEVSVYDRCLGDVPGRNALVWEVRRY